MSKDNCDGDTVQDFYKKMINDKCSVNNFPIDTHKDYKCV